MTVFTYDLGVSVDPGFHRPLILTRTVRFTLSDFSSQFIAGANLPSGSLLDNRIKEILNVT